MKLLLCLFAVSLICASELAVPIAPAARAQSGAKPVPVDGSQEWKVGAIHRGLWVNAGPNAKSRDGSKAGPVFVKDVAEDLTNDTLYIAAISTSDSDPAGGVYASSDGGKSWRKLYGLDCSQVVPTGSDRLYAMEAKGGKIIRSEDGGKTWTYCPTPRYRYAGGVDNAYIECIASSPGNNAILYAGAEGSAGAGLYKSQDGGRTWLYPTKSAMGHYSGGNIEVRDTECRDIAVDPENPNIVYATFNAMPCESSDGGVHFFGCTGLGKGAGPAQRSSGKAKVIKPGRFQIDPVTPNIAYLRCVESNKDRLYRTTDGGRTWSSLSLPGAGFINTIVETPGKPQTAYAATERGLSVTEDGGKSWKPLASGNAPKSAGGFTIPSVFTGTAFKAVGTVVNTDEPILFDPLTGHLVYGTALGMRVLVPAQ